MEFKEVIGLRRSIRYFKPWRPVEREKIQTMLEAARLASRSVNAPYPKAVVLFRDKVSEEDRNALKLPTTTTQLDLAPVWIFWFGDLEAVQKTNKGQTLHALIDAGALGPSHGWSHRYVDDVIWAQVLKPMTENAGALALMVAEETSLAICHSVLTAVDEGLGTTLTAINQEACRRLLKVPDTYMPIWLQLVGYPAEEREAGGQRPREPFEEMFFEGGFDTPFRRDEAVVEKLREKGMIQAPAPLPWRRAELRALSTMFELPE